KTIEQEAALCVALQMAYNVYMYVGPKDELKKQTILNRSCRVLEQLPASLLRCQLLVYCYGEVYNEDFALEAHRIIEDWVNRAFTGEEQEIVSELEAKEEYFKIIF
ncbi:MAG: UpxZ family transcription anti-terminator antagonist, partial [Bacteroidaceae bacterium]